MMCDVSIRPRRWPEDDIVADCLAPLGVRNVEGTRALGNTAINPADMFGLRHEFLQT
jgi:hypothetical protein